jgi:hypothetical protein
MITHKALAIHPIVNPTTSPAPSAPTELSTAVHPDASPIRLACVEVCSVRRLAKTRLDLDETTMILIGANNSDKTSLLIGLRNFLSESPGFRAFAFDISLSQWAKLRELSHSGRRLTRTHADPARWEPRANECPARDHPDGLRDDRPLDPNAPARGRRGYMLLRWSVDRSPDHRLKDEQCRLWLSDPLALYGVEHANLAPGYQAPSSPKKR